MADSTDISRSIEAIRTAIYGKDVREAIASGIELCYNYVGGQQAIEAAERATREVGHLAEVVSGSEDTLNELRTTAAEADSWVKISEEQPTEASNKIWIKPRAEQEYKVATYDAYSELWDHVNELDQVYNSGHGGIKSITLNPEYEGVTQYEKQYIIEFSDGSKSYFYVNDGQKGDAGPVDNFTEIEVRYKVTTKLTKTPPVDGWVEQIPTTIKGGQYLWTQAILKYSSSKVGYIYSVARQGKDGSGTMDSIQFGNSGQAETGAVVVPMDDVPTADSTSSLVFSGGIYTGINNAISNLCGLTVSDLTNIQSV